MMIPESPIQLECHSTEGLYLNIQNHLKESSSRPAQNKKDKNAQQI